MKAGMCGTQPMETEVHQTNHVTGLDFVKVKDENGDVIETFTTGSDASDDAESLSVELFDYDAEV